MGLHAISYAAGVGLALGYVAANAALQAWFYGGKAGGTIASWKLQPQRAASCGAQAAGAPWLPWVHKPGRHAMAPLFAGINIVMASCFSAAVAECIVRGCSVVDTTPGAWTCASVAAQLLVATVWQSVLEYYYHRLMHLPAVYRHLHKYHHANTAPEPFDDMLIHPFEAFLYYCILYSPALVVPMHLYGFLAYMALMGVTGILDHCGVKFSLPGVYTTRDHDRHHEKFNVNYGFPFPWLDLAHGTFDGRFWGKEFRVKSAPA